jgi:hypothetical protein
LAPGAILGENGATPPHPAGGNLAYRSNGLQEDFPGWGKYFATHYKKED